MVNLVVDDSATARIEVIQRGATLGAEIRGIDFSRATDRATADSIHDALMAHKVVFFRRAEMNPAQHVAFGRLFGELTVHPFVPHLEEHPEVVVLDNHKDNPVFSTDVWHSDEIEPIAFDSACAKAHVDIAKHGALP